MGTFNSFRKAYGALKDSTKVGLAKVNSEYKNLDIAIVKATNHVEYPPQERHVRTTSIIRPRADVAFCINALAKRLSKTRSWIVAIKILIVIHRTLREGDPTFREEILNYASKGRIFQISNFKDDSSPLAWDCSAWVRTYAMFLEERLECFRVLKYDIETERLTKSTPAASKAHSKTRFVSSAELVEQLPALQQLLFRLFNCQPEGAAYSNTLVQYALALVLKESFKIYCAINDGIINLVDMFFDMPKHEAVRAFNMYKRAGQQAENLAEFYECCKGLDMARTFQFPTLRQPPPSFLSSMEEYIKEAPQTAASVQNKLAYEGRQQPPPYEAVVTEKHEEKVEQPKSLIDEEEDIKPQDKAQEPQPLISTDITDDLLGLNIEETNALALAIVQPEGTNSGSGGLSETGGSGWEIALVTAPTNNTTTNVVEHKMGGGFDKFLLDSLYENEAARRQLQMTNAGYGYGHNGMSMQNSYQHHHHFQDPFMMSSNVAQQDQMLFHQQQQQQQQQHQHQQQQQMMMVPYQLQSQSPYFQHPQYYPQQQMTPQMGMGAPNPFGDPFSNNLQPCPPTKGNYALL